MASTANISAVTTANTFDNWRIQTNLDTIDVNEVCRGDFYKPQGSINVAIGYIEISNVNGGFTALRVPYGDATISSGKLTVAKIDQIGATNFIYAAATDIRFTNDALNFHAMGNTRTIRLYNNNISVLANVNTSGYLEMTGVHSNNGLILNVASFITVSNTVRLGNVTISSNLSVSRNVTVGGNVSVGLYANVAGSLNVGTTLEVSRNAFAYANLTVSQNTTIRGNVSVGSFANIAGTVNVGSTLEVSRNIIGYANLIVGQNASITGNVSIGSRANVTGSLNVGTTLEVSRNATLYANLIVAQNSSIGGNVSVGTFANVGSTLGVGGNLTVGGTTTMQDFHVIEGLANANIGAAGTRRIYYFPTAQFSCAKMLIEMQSTDASFGANVPATQLSEAVVTQVNGNAHITVYATVSSPPTSTPGSSLLGTFSSSVVSGNVEVYVTTTYASCTSKVVANLIK